MLKICLIGPKLSGKTSFVEHVQHHSRQKNQQFPGIHFQRKQLLNGHQALVLQYWDICGKLCYKNDAKNIADNSDLVLFFFRPQTNDISRLEQWIECFENSSQEIAIVINQEPSLPIPEEIIRMRNKYGWKIFCCNVKNENQCLDLEKQILKTHFPGKYYNQLSNHKNRNKLLLISTAVSIGCLLTWKLIKK